MSRFNLAWFQVKQEIEDFLYTEAEYLDSRAYDAWLNMLDEDLTYFMPLRRNVRQGDDTAHENTRQGEDISWFDEDKWTLQKRVEQIQTGVHWAEEPHSRVCHMVSNIQLQDVTPSPEAARDAVVKSRFLVYQNRVETEAYFFVGKRTDHLRKHGDDWKLYQREIILDQNVLLAKNLTVFF